MKIIKWCIKNFLITRLIFITFVEIIYNTGFIEKYDLSTEILTSPKKDINKFEQLVLNFLKHFCSYDAIHFIYISKNNYTNDNIFAFYPFYPILIKGLSLVLNIILPFKGEYTTSILAGFILSNTFCCLNTILLYSIIILLTNNNTKGKICVLLYLLNPGTIFFISDYSENLYLSLELLFIYYIIKISEETTIELNEKDKLNFISKKPYLLYIIVLFLNIIPTRSNGVGLLTFFVVPCFCVLFYKKKYLEKFISEKFFSNFLYFLNRFKLNFQEIGKYVVLSFMTYLYFLYYSKIRPKNYICDFIKYEEDKEKTKYDFFYKWCTNSNESEINSFYSYIQKEYWDVGFLKQYALNHLDRIILAFPLNVFSIYLLYKIIVYFDVLKLIKNFDFHSFLMKNTLFIDSKNNYNKDNKIKETVYVKNLITNSFIIGASLNYFASFIVCLVMAHPQINNRLLSCCPIIYFMFSEDIEIFINKKGEDLKGFLIISFFISFSFLSCLMQVGFYSFA